jgi:hypothetical protein
MLSELQQDILVTEVANRLPLQDLITVSLTCRYVRDAMAPLLARAKTYLHPKQQLWRSVGQPKVEGSRVRDDHSFIVAEEWASPHFTISDALAMFNLKIPIVIHVIASSGAQCHMDKALERLVSWIPHVLENVYMVHFESQPNDATTWKHIHDKHVKLFYNATHVQVNDCENITDKSLLHYTRAESIDVNNCVNVTGSFVNHLVTRHQLRHLYWSFTKRTAPLDLITSPPQLLKDALALGAMQLTMSWWHGSGLSCWGPGTYLVKRLKPGDYDLASMATALSLEPPSPCLLS